jgi:uncharacterized membrane protein
MGYLKNFMILVGVFLAGIIAMVLAWIAIPLLVVFVLGLLAAVIIHEQRVHKTTTQQPTRPVKYEIKPRSESEK